MLLKFSSTDILNANLEDAISGNVAYRIVTSMLEGTLSSSSSAEADGESPHQSRRRTTIHDSKGAFLCEITWNGRRPSIRMGTENFNDLSKLYDTCAARITSDEFVIPSRLDTGYVWHATPTSLRLIARESNTIKGTFHQNAFRTPKSRIVQTGLPGFGHNYLEFEEDLIAPSIEIIVSFLMMEILRRGCFSLTPYMFDRPKLWQLRETKDLFMRRLRSNTY